MSCNNCEPYRVALATDHGGFALKMVIGEHLKGRGIEVLDLGTDSTTSVDYPEYAQKLAEAMLSGEAEKGILFCGAGIGMSMVANRYKGIRAALCHDHFTAVVSRRHNDANVLVLGGRILGPDLAIEIVDTWLATPFEGGRHARRVDKIDA